MIYINIQLSYKEKRKVMKTDNILWYFGNMGDVGESK